MAISFPTFTPVVTYSALDYGQYVTDQSTTLLRETFRVDSTLVPNGKSSILLRADLLKNSAESSTTAKDVDLSAYMVIRGYLDSFTNAEILSLAGRAPAILTHTGNLLRLQQGQR